MAVTLELGGLVVAHAFRAGGEAVVDQTGMQRADQFPTIKYRPL
jgi:hypothetical protein